MFRNDAVRESEADPVPFRFGGKEWNKDALQIGRRDPFARVLDSSNGPPLARLIFFTRAGNGNAALRSVRADGFGSVA